MSSGTPNVTGPGPDRALGPAWGCGWAWLWFWLLVLVIIFAGWGWRGWREGWGGPWGWWEARQAPPQASTAGGEFLGKTVTVSGQVEQVLGPHVFTLAGGLGGRQLLIIGKNGTTATVKKGESVQVTGTVEKYDTGELHKQTGVDLSKVPPAEFAGRPTVVASAVSSTSSPS